MLKMLNNNFEFTPDEYLKKRKDFLGNKISLEIWSLYCILYLNELMELNADVLKRLAER